MRIWPGWRISLERATPKRCRFSSKDGGGLAMRCIFHAGHPNYGHTLTDDLTSPPVAAAVWRR